MHNRKKLMQTDRLTHAQAVWLAAQIIPGKVVYTVARGWHFERTGD